MGNGFLNICRRSAVVVLMFVSACAGYQHGNGPLTLSEKVEAGFQEYLKLKVPLAFAVTTDGKNAGWYYCNHISTCTQSVAEGKAVSFCQRGAAQGADCKIYAVGRKVVWKGPVKTASRSLRTQGVPVGKGPVLVSDKVARAFNAYKNLPDPLAFAISLDGKNAGWFSCNRKDTCADVDAKPIALDSCQKYSPEKSSCRIYAIGKVVVWEGQVMVENPINRSPKVAAKPESNPEIMAKVEPVVPEPKPTSRELSQPIAKEEPETAPPAEPEAERKPEAKTAPEPEPEEPALEEEPETRVASAAPESETTASEQKPAILPAPKQEGFLTLPDTGDVTTLASTATPDMPPIEAVPSKPVSEMILPEPTVRSPSIADDILSLGDKLRNSKAFNDIEEEIKRLQIN